MWIYSRSSPVPYIWGCPNCGSTDAPHYECECTITFSTSIGPGEVLRMHDDCWDMDPLYNTGLRCRDCDYIIRLPPDTEPDYANTADHVVPIMVRRIE